MTEQQRSQSEAGRDDRPFASGWSPTRPRVRLFALIMSWLVSGIALLAAAYLVPGASATDFRAAVAAAAVIALMTALLPPLVAALRLPFTLVVGFLLVLCLDAALLLV